MWMESNYSHALRNKFFNEPFREEEPPKEGERHDRTLLANPTMEQVFLLGLLINSKVKVITSKFHFTACSSKKLFY